MTAVLFDGGQYTDFSEGQDVMILVRFRDGTQVTLRPDSEMRDSAEVRFDGADFAGTRLDVSASVDADGTQWAFWASKTGVSGIDGGLDIPEAAETAARASAARHASDARKALARITRRTRQTA